MNRGATASELRVAAVRQSLREEPDLDKQGARTAAELIPACQEVRSVADRLEARVSRDLWPMPSYVDLLFRH